MASTTNLGLTVDQAGTTKFWNRNAQTETHVKTVDDNFRLIDEFAGTKGQVDGLASLDSTGKVPSSQLPDISAGIEIDRL